MISRTLGRAFSCNTGPLGGTFPTPWGRTEVLFGLMWNRTSLGRKRLTHSVLGTSLAKDKTNQICPNGSLRET